MVEGFGPQIRLPIYKTSTEVLITGRLPIRCDSFICRTKFTFSAAYALSIIQENPVEG